MTKLSRYDKDLILSLVDKNQILDAIDERLYAIATRECKYTRDDFWQEEATELLQLKYKLVTSNGYGDYIRLLKDQLNFLDLILTSDIDNVFDINSFFDIKITVNGLEYELTMDAELHRHLMDYFNENIL